MASDDTSTQATEASGMPGAGSDSPLTPPATEAADAPVKVPRRRAAKKAAEPAQEPATDSAGADGAPAKAARRSRKKVAAPVESLEAETSGAPAPTESSPTESSPTESTPAKSAPAKRSRRATTKVAAPAPAPAPELTLNTGNDTDTTDDAEADEDLDGAAQAAADSAPAPDPEPAAPASVGFGLVFQAPDPTVRRSRRATAPAAAPVIAPAEPEQRTEAGSEVASEDTADSGTPRRGRTGRRGQAASDTVAPNEGPSDDDRDQESAGESAEDGETPGDTNDSSASGRRRRRGGRGRRARTPGQDESQTGAAEGDARTSDDDESGSAGSAGSGAGPESEAGEPTESATSRRRRRRRRGSAGEGDDPPGTVTRVREPRTTRDEPTAVKGSTRLEAKKQRRREGREAGRRRTIITEAEFLARREAVDRVMVVRGQENLTQIGVLEDGVLVEHYVSRDTSNTMVGNVYLGRVQNVLPSMEAAFVDIGKGRNAVLYAGEVNWDAAGLEVNQAKRIENALTSGDTVLVQVTKDPIGHKGARLTSQISLPGRFLVYVPEGSMTGISRKLPDTERARLKAILKEIVPDSAGVIVRTAAEGASEEELRADVERLTKAWEKIQKKTKSANAKKAGSGGAPLVVHGEPDLTVRVIRDIFTEDFSQLVVSGEKAWEDVSEYVEDVAPDLAQRLTRWTSEQDVFSAHRVQEQIAKAMDRKVWLPSGGSLVIDRTEAMTVVDVNTGKFVGSGGNLEETVTKNNIEAAEEIVRQLRLRDIGGIIVIDFIDMVLESNRDLVVRRLLECLGRDRTKHQVAEVTSLGLVQMTRKRVGSGLIEVFGESCEHCGGRGIVVHAEPIDKSSGNSGSHATSNAGNGEQGSNQRSTRGRRGTPQVEAPEPERKPSGPTAAQIAAAAHAAAVKRAAAAAETDGAAANPRDGSTDQDAPADVVRELEGDDVRDDERGVHSDSPAPESKPESSSSTEEAPDDHDEAAALDVTVPVSEFSGALDEEAVPAPEPEASPAAPRGRRRRGRVVAPAGPPRSADSGDLEAAPSGQ